MYSDVDLRFPALTTYKKMKEKRTLKCLNCHLSMPQLPMDLGECQVCKSAVYFHAENEYDCFNAEYYFEAIASYRR